MLTDADKLLKRFAALDKDRSKWVSRWKLCDTRVMPWMDADTYKTSSIVSSPSECAQVFAAAMESWLVPRTQKWHSLVTGDTELDQDPDASRYLGLLRDILFAARYAPQANFASQITMVFYSLALYGTAVLMIDDRLGRGLRYQFIPIQEVYLADDAGGRIDTVFRLYKLTARQAREEFGDELPAEIRLAGENETQMETEFEFIHAVFPRKDFDRSRADSRNLPIASYHVARAAKKVVRESGYRTMPYAVTRYVVVPGERVYGRSPAMFVMPDICQLNEMEKTLLRAAQHVVHPPLLVTSEDVVRAVNLKSGGLTHDAVSSDGRPLVLPLNTGGNVPIGLDLIKRKEESVQHAFHVNLFQILLDSPQRTATEVLQRTQEKAQLLNPIMGGQHSELLRTIIDREVDILAAAGAIPPPPEELAERGAEVHPRYETEMANAMNSREGLNILQAFESVQPMAQINPEVLDLINMPEAARKVWESFGAPSSVLRTPEEVAQLREARARQQREAQEMQQAQAALGVIESLAGQG